MKTKRALKIAHSFQWEGLGHWSLGDLTAAALRLNEPLMSLVGESDAVLFYWPKKVEGEFAVIAVLGHDLGICNMLDVGDICGRLPTATVRYRRLRAHLRGGLWLHAPANMEWPRLFPVLMRLAKRYRSVIRCQLPYDCVLSVSPVNDLTDLVVMYSNIRTVTALSVREALFPLIAKLQELTVLAPVMRAEPILSWIRDMLPYLDHVTFGEVQLELNLVKDLLVGVGYVAHAHSELLIEQIFADAKIAQEYIVGGFLGLIEESVVPVRALESLIEVYFYEGELDFANFETEGDGEPVGETASA